MSSRTSNDEASSGCVLAISHPGHELRVAHWVEINKPTIFILTSGSRSGTSRRRVEASAQLAASLGATAGSIFGSHLDREVYGWIISGQAERFTELAELLAGAFVRGRARTVLTDSWQLYNVVHDLWHLTVRVAAAKASQVMNRPIEVLDYPVVPEAPGLPPLGRERWRIELTPEQVRRKLELASAYPELADDVAEVVEKGGHADITAERLHDPLAYGELARRGGRKPLYESFGEARVAAGLYKTVLRWRHVEPIASCLASRLEPALAA
jgi:hypothetical protein